MEIEPLAVKLLKLDLRNYRAMPQDNEEEEVEVLVTLDPGYFWGLAKSLLKNGCMANELIVVLKGARGKLSVREGNRRVAFLKLALGYLKGSKLDIPADIRDDLDSLTDQWKEENKEIYCLVFEPEDEALVIDIVGRTHAKGDKASRLDWGATPRARFARDERGAKVPELDLLEKYLEEGSKVNDMQRGRWSSDYYLSVLEAAIPRLATRLGCSSPADLVKKYPAIKHRTALESVLEAIGLRQFGFNELRDKSDILFSRYGIPQLADKNNPGVSGAGSGSGSSGAGGGASSGTSSTDGSTGTSVGGTSGTSTKARAVPLTDPKSVIKALKALVVRGDARDKVATLVAEAASLNVGKTPLAFCFLLRSMFEISAAAYIVDNKSSNPVETVEKKSGKPKTLGKLLLTIKKHYLDKQPDNATREIAKKLLHGAGKVLENPTSILSVTSLNNLVHSPNFTGKPADICVDFHNVFPLLKVMNS